MRENVSKNLHLYITIVLVFLSLNFVISKETTIDPNPKDSIQNLIPNANVELSSYLPSLLKLPDNSLLEIDFGKTFDGLSSNQLITNELLVSFKNAIVIANKNLSENEKITQIHISSTTNGKHSFGSNHYYGTAIDISQINKTKLIHLGANRQVRELQKALSSLDNIRENFGPYIKQKFRLNGIPDERTYVGGHQDHIHFSVQGIHNAEDCDCSDSLIYRENIKTGNNIEKPIIIVD